MRRESTLDAAFRLSRTVLLSHTLNSASARALLVVAGLLPLFACGSNEPMGLVVPPPLSISLVAGASAAVPNGQEVNIAGGASGGEYLMVVTDTTASATGTSAYKLAVTGVAGAGTVSAPSASRFPSGAVPSANLLFGGASLDRNTLDIGYGTRLNEQYRQRFTSMFGSARAFARGASTVSTAPSGLSRSVAATTVAVGDMVTYNVGPRACDSLINHPTRVVAVGASAIIAVDTLNPPGGFTAADYQRFAANFDTLIYPLDVANFGAPNDIDNNGRVILLFTRAVNELTPRNSQSFVGGFFFSRDLFPHTATPALQACLGSNMAEMFYLLAPDPAGLVNGNIRTAGFVDSLTTGVVGHEFQHLINASRRIYTNNANDLETVWLNEGLSHIAEELLFFRQGGFAPRQNIDIARLRTSQTTRNAFNQDQGANAARYREYLKSPSTNSPIRNDDSLATRGATWDFLRYATDQKVGTGGQDAGVFQALVNAKTVGVANLRGVYGADLGGMLRDWSLSHYTDDVTPGVSAMLSQPSWNWHDVYTHLGSATAPPPPYPLDASQLPLAGVNGTVIPGGSAYYRFAVPANGNAAITLSGGTAAAGVAQGTIVRIR